MILSLKFYAAFFTRLTWQNSGIKRPKLMHLLLRLLLAVHHIAGVIGGWLFKKSLYPFFHLANHFLALVCHAERAKGCKHSHNRADNNSVLFLFFFFKKHFVLPSAVITAHNKYLFLAKSAYLPKKSKAQSFFCPHKYNSPKKKKYVPWQNTV